jgi:hypothetical protein
MFKIKKFYLKNNHPYYDTSELIIHIRGHVRDSFNTPQLYMFLKNLSHQFKLTIYIHTWSIKANGISWQKVVEDKSSVTEKMIRDYFKDLPIDTILIDNDNIPLIGNTTGNMFSSSMPKIGWKNMWYGMYEIMKINHKSKVLILNIRFDIFINSCKITEYDLMKWLITTLNNIKYQKISNNYLIQDSLAYGIDNQFIGDKDTLYKLIHHFHHNLDEINQYYFSLKHQEFSVYHENNRIF